MCQWPKVEPFAKWASHACSALTHEISALIKQTKEISAMIQYGLSLSEFMHKVNSQKYMLIILRRKLMTMMFGIELPWLILTCFTKGGCTKLQTGMDTPCLSSRDTLYCWRTVPESRLPATQWHSQKESSKQPALCCLATARTYFSLLCKKIYIYIMWGFCSGEWLKSPPMALAF